MAKNKVGNDMRIKDLKSGYLVETRNGERFFVARYSSFEKLLVGKSTKYELMVNYDESFNHCALKELDIMKIWGLAIAARCVFDLNSEHDRPLIWERVEPKKMTLEEIEKALGYPIMVVNGRDIYS